jgi:integrase
MKFWTREQFEQQFIAVVDNETYKALFSFLFYTGRRKGEIFALYKTDIHGKTVTFDKSVNRRTFRQGKWEVTGTKEEKTCTLPVCKPVQEIIQTYQPPNNGKFYFGGVEPLAPTTVERYFKKYTAMANLPPIRIHDLRHSFVSMLIHLGANFMVIADLISDTVEMVTKTYGHLYVDDRDKVVAMI